VASRSLDVLGTLTARHDVKPLDQLAGPATTNDGVMLGAGDERDQRGHRRHRVDEQQRTFRARPRERRREVERGEHCRSCHRRHGNRPPTSGYAPSTMPVGPVTLVSGSPLEVDRVSIVRSRRDKTSDDVLPRVEACPGGSIEQGFLQLC
jgi:hypothetical protein